MLSGRCLLVFNQTTQEGSSISSLDIETTYGLSFPSEQSMDPRILFSKYLCSIWLPKFVALLKIENQFI